MTYIESNIMGFTNILESCRYHKIKHLVYASSSSVYGKNEEIPFEETDQVDSPISLYAATKKANELMAHTYKSFISVANFRASRFFTVYANLKVQIWLQCFCGSNDEWLEIKVFNNGEMSEISLMWMI